MIPPLSDQICLLGAKSFEESLNGDAANGDVQNSVLFSAEVWNHYGSGLLPQFGF